MPLRWSSTERFLSLAEHLIGSIAVAGASSHPPSPPRTSRQQQAPQSEEIGLIAFFRPTRRTFRLHRRLVESSIGQCTGSPQGCNQWRPTAGARWLTGDPTTHHYRGLRPRQRVYQPFGLRTISDSDQRMFSFWDVRDESFPKCFLLNLTLKGTSIHHEAIYLNHPHHPRNPTTEHTEHTEREPSFFRGFRVFRG